MNVFGRSAPKYAIRQRWYAAAARTTGTVKKTALLVCRVRTKWTDSARAMVTATMTPSNRSSVTPTSRTPRMAKGGPEAVASRLAMRRYGEQDREVEEAFDRRLHPRAGPEREWPRRHRQDPGAVPRGALDALAARAESEDAEQERFEERRDEDDERCAVDGANRVGDTALKLEDGRVHEHVKEVRVTLNLVAWVERQLASRDEVRGEAHRDERVVDEVEALAAIAARLEEEHREREQRRKPAEL